jgi:AcrR family transcriptional regulator
MATRHRVVAAAAPLFVRDGYVETTMAGIARAAGVAVQTLYLSFGSKAASNQRVDGMPDVSMIFLSAKRETIQS